MLSDLKLYALLAAHAGVIIAYILVAAGIIGRAVHRQSIVMSPGEVAYFIAASALLIWAVR